MTVLKLRTSCILTQAEAVLGKIGYPDYLDSDNVTKLESIYAEVCYRHATSSYRTNCMIVVY